MFFLSLILILTGLILIPDFWLPLLGVGPSIVAELFVIVGLNLLLETFERIPRPEEFDWTTKIRALLVIYSNGIHLFSRFWREGQVIEEPDLISGALVAVKAVLEEMVGPEKMQTVTLEDQTLLFEYRERFSCVIFAEEPLKSLRVRLRQFADEFSNLFSPVLEDWRGLNEIFVPAETIADTIFLPKLQS
jgi:hypothetical protein